MAHRIESLFAHEKNKYMVVNLVAKRMKKLAQGEQPLVKREPNEDFVSLAAKEVLQGKVKGIQRQKKGKVIDLAKQD